MQRNLANSITSKFSCCFLSLKALLIHYSAKIVYVKGRQHPVKIYHSATSQTDYVDAALRTFFQIHIDEPRGDVLIFLPGWLFPMGASCH